MKYCNPIIKGFHPDPSICCVGEDYYLVTSSFEYFPGIPIFHSSDLVNWKQIGNCVTKAREFPMEKVKDSGGIWAPTIRYHQGIFYVTSTLEQHGNFIVSAEDPAGEWSSPVWVPVGGIDPSLLFEKDKVYYCTNQSLHIGREEISLEEINIQTGALIGEQKTIWNGTGGGFLEAPHIYSIGEWYYLIVAEGGTQFNHMITMSRSKSIWGPYESCPWNPILTNAHDTSKEVQCSGHGDLFQDHLGNWWFVHLAIRLSRRTMSHLGRETFLTPVIWKEGWLVVEHDKKALLENEGPLWEEQKKSKAWEPDFYRKDWEPEWIFLRNPIKSSYHKGDGKLILHPTMIGLGDGKNPTFAAVRQNDFKCEAEVCYQFEPCRIGDEAGLAIVLTSEFYYTIGKKSTSNGDVLLIEKRAVDFYQEVYCVSIKKGKVNIRVQGDKEYYRFYYSMDEMPLEEIGKISTRFLSCELAGKCFTGTVIGLYAVSTKETKAAMEIEKFCMKGK